jgi:hypothetical protein
MYHLMNDVASGKAGASALTAHFAHADSTFPAGAYKLAFTTNHDENSWNGTEFERMGANAQAAFVVTTTVQQSFPLVYSGQEVSVSKRLRFFDKDTIDWTGPSLAPFYRAMFALKHAQPALANGADGGKQTVIAHDAGDRVFVFQRTVGKNAVLVAANFGDADVAAHLRDVPAVGVFRDWFGGTSVTLAREATLAVPKHGWVVLTRGGKASTVPKS